MSPQKRVSPSPSPSPSPTTHDFKSRVIGCLNKLADRDTLSVATNELESIARSLTQDSFSSFIICLQNTDSSSKSPVRKQCVSLLTLLSESHGNSLSPHLPKMVSTVARRLRDPDSAVRSACVAATSAMSTHITKPSFSVLSKPLIELVLVEQDANSQIGGAMCLAAAIEAAPNLEAEQMRKLLPRLGKVVKCEGFKAKAAVLGLIGSVVEVGGAKSKGVLEWLVPCLVEFLSSNDWATRKSAAEVLGKVALSEKNLAADYRNNCLAALENRRFDKVKLVRETMNRTLELWKEVPGANDEVSALSPSKSVPPVDKDSAGCFPSIAKRSHDIGFRTPKPKKVFPVSRSPSSDGSCVTTARSEISLKNNNKKSTMPALRRLDNNRKSSDWNVEIAVSNSPSSKSTSADQMRVTDCQDSELGNSVSSRIGTKSIFNKIPDEKQSKFGGLRSGPRVVPYDVGENSDLVVDNGVEEVYEYPKDPEDLSQICEQLLQIENQQSSLLDLLQRFIGSSQSGLNSLETRVHGLEMALDEISYDLGLSNGGISSYDSPENTCCKLPGTEFLSPKFWRRAEGRFFTSRSPSCEPIQSFHVSKSPDHDVRSGMYKTENQRIQHLNRDGFVLNPSADMLDLRRNSGFHSNRRVKNIFQDADRLQIRNTSGLNVVSSSAAC